MSSSVVAVQPLGPVESTSVLRTGARRRSMLAANSVLGDLFCLGGDRLLRMYNPKAGKLRCVQQLRPQLVDSSFLRATPDFWSQPAHEQHRLISEAHGARTLDIPHEVVAIELHESAGLVALVGVHRVSILVLPPAASLSAPPDAADELGALLGQLGLGEYGAGLREHGYDHVGSLLRMNSDERHAMTQTIGMRPGHAQTLLMHLDGRLPPTAAVSADDTTDSGRVIPCWATALPLASHGGLTPAKDEARAAVSAPFGQPTPIAPSTTAAANNPRRCSFGAPMTAATARHSPTPSLSSSIGSQNKGAFRQPAPNPVVTRAEGAPYASPGPALVAAAGVTVVQVGWHPLGDAHLAVLLSDGTFHLFDTSSDTLAPCLTLVVPRRAAQLTPREPPPRMPTSGGVDGPADGASPIGFGFGGVAQLGWTSLCAFFGTAAGDVYVACPVLPTGRRAAHHLTALAPSLEAALDDVDHSDDGVNANSIAASRAWLRRRTAAHTAAATSEAAQAIVSRPPSGGDPPVRMQGPLRFDGEASTPACRAISLLCIPLPGGLVGVLMGLEDHSVLIGMLTAAPLPGWADGSPLAQSGGPYVPTISLGSPTPASRHPRPSLGGITPAPLGGIATPAPSSGMRGAPKTEGRIPMRGAINEDRKAARASLGGRAASPNKDSPQSQSQEPPSPAGTPAGGEGAGEGAGCELTGGAALIALSRARLEPYADEGAAARSEDEPLRWMHLTADKVVIGRILVHASSGALHLLELPWLYDWALFLQAAADDPSPPPVPPAESAAQVLLAIGPSPSGASGVATAFPAASPTHTSHPDARFRKGAGVVGIAALRDPALGDSVFAMTNDGKCTKVQMELVPLASSAAAGAGAVAAVDAAGDNAVEREHTRAIHQLSHRKSEADSVADQMAWARSKAELADAAPADVLSSFERALTTLAGPGSKLREWGSLAEESATRLERLEKQTGTQPGIEKALGVDLTNVDSELVMLAHKARLAAAVQDNLEARTKALRAVLRQPTLWPAGGLSVEEERQHRELLALRDRVLEGQRMMHELIAAKQGQHATGAPAGGPMPTGAARKPPVARVPTFGAGGISLGSLGQGIDPSGLDLGDGGEDDEDADLDEENAELLQQDALLQRLVSSMRRAKQQGEEALALVQAAAAQYE